MTRLISLDETPALDLNYRHFEHLAPGNILVIGSWVIDSETRQSQPCMVLIDNTRRMRRQRYIPCVIPLSSLWLWTREMGDPEHVAGQIGDWMRAGALLGSPHNKADVFRVIDAVQSRLRDLWSMPPMPPRAAVKHGAVPVGVMELIERETGEVVNEIEVATSHAK